MGQYRRLQAWEVMLNPALDAASPLTIPAQASWAVELLGQSRTGTGMAPLRRVWSSQPSQAPFFKVKKEEFPTRQKGCERTDRKGSTLDVWMKGAERNTLLL